MKSKSWQNATVSNPESKGDNWSREVIAYCENGEAYNISCYKGSWQQTSLMVSEGAGSVLFWIDKPIIN